MNGAHTSVVASIATHIRPRWCDRVTKVIVASAANKLAQKTRLGLPARRDKYPGRYNDERKNKTLRKPSTTLANGSNRSQPPRPERGSRPSHWSIAAKTKATCSKDPDGKSHGRQRLVGSANVAAAMNSGTRMSK